MTNEKEEAWKINITTNEENPWWKKDIAAAIQPQARQMLQEYAGVPPEKQVEHIEKARKKAWDILPWPSIGALTWLNSYIDLHHSHDLILAKAKEGAKILDCGCFIAPDLRYLAWKGAPTKNLYAFDVEGRFFDIGFDFYNDRITWQGKFIAADGTKDPESTDLGQLIGSVDVIWCPKYLHLFNREAQVEVACHLVKLLKPVPGSIFIGSQNGLPEPAEFPMKGVSFPGQTATGFMANADATEEIWNEVAQRTGTEWDVTARLLDLRTLGLHEDDGSVYKKKTGYNLQWTATLTKVIRDQS